MKRKLSELERDLVSYLLGRSPPDTTEVEPMSDGEMGSLRFCGPDGRKFGRSIAETTFIDADGVPVSVELNADQFGELFELDIFKVDFSPLLRIPPRSALKNSD